MPNDKNGSNGEEKDNNDDIDTSTATGSSVKKWCRILQESSKEDKFNKLDGDESEEEEGDSKSGTKSGLATNPQMAA